MKIRLERITKSFEKKQVIRQTDLTIESGSFTTLLGPAGCGKTTLPAVFSLTSRFPRSTPFCASRCGRNSRIWSRRSA